LRNCCFTIPMAIDVSSRHLKRRFDRRRLAQRLQHDTTMFGTHFAVSLNARDLCHPSREVAHCSAWTEIRRALLTIDRHCAPHIYIRRHLYLKKFQFDAKKIRHHANRRVLTCGESSAKNVTRSRGVVHAAERPYGRPLVRSPLTWHRMDYRVKGIAGVWTFR
jgi:hypothetical protein